MFSSASDESLLTQPEFCSDSEEYEVECVKKKRYRNGLVEYFVKFTGYDDSESCWIPEKELENAREAVAEYELAMKKRVELENFSILDESLPSDKRALRTGAIFGHESQCNLTTETSEDSKVAKQPTQPQHSAIPVKLKAAEHTPVERLPNPSFQQRRKRFHSGRPGNDSGFHSQISVSNQIHPPPRSSAPQSIVVATNGQSGVELGKMVVNIIAHKPAELRIRSLNDVQYLINYADHPQDFVPHAVCIQHIPVHVTEYLAQTQIVSFQWG
ncbi:uncharacterized protein LOC129594544 [Paramacrobiotus metropolitanus]|uniref:uncharacterized protein LOC129594544 n=1 Tax=Paramacrobiotus metropolitanus TaxID=2943436 RepID=UPI002445FEF4|nr:uncharacterized protein LOC129594544 [Paramacrobiotus metropolitanus]XP_055347241.1 uncharacterized protein LOC129594544 [Paramacrobiotus metropolitanus]